MANASGLLVSALLKLSKPKASSHPVAQQFNTAQCAPPLPSHQIIETNRPLQQNMTIKKQQAFPNSVSSHVTLGSYPWIVAGLVFMGQIQAAPAQTLTPTPSEQAFESPDGVQSGMARSNESPALSNKTSPPAHLPDYSVSPTSPTAANFLWPLADTLGINLAMWGITKLAGAEYADVQPWMWKENFQTGFRWDDNSFKLNQVGHPYHGSLYFTVARANGLSFWQSIPYVMFGSFQWEFFMETEQPSTNDWITTSWGGTFLGEVLFRLSNRLLDDRKSGSTRFWKELSALAVSPMNGLDRLVTGKSWQDGPAGKQHPLTTNLRVGADGIGLSDGTAWGDTFRFRMRFDYGDPFAQKRLRIPFEVFDLAFQFNAGGNILGQSLDGTGVLLGDRIRSKSNQHLLAWVMDFEYFTNGPTRILSEDRAGLYQLGETGTGFGWYGHFGLGSGFTINTRADALFVPMGAISSPYARYDANRDYNYSLGGASKFEINLRQERWGRIYAIANRYWYHVIDGALGSEIFGSLQMGAYLNAYQGHGIGGSLIHYDRRAYYNDYPNLEDSFWTAQLHYEFEY